MANSFFQFKQFTIQQDRCAMKVTTDSCLFGSFIPVINKQEGNLRILDIGTGTGLLALMLAQKKTAAIIDAIEIDPGAFQQARENVGATAWEARIHVIHADANTFKPAMKYDMVISNPPFYENDLQAGSASKNLARHQEGLLLHQLLTIIKKQLQPDGRFYLLLPYKRHAEIRELLTAHEMAIQQMIFVRPSPHHDYFRIILEGKFIAANPAEILIDEIAIKGDTNEYSPAFVNLLKDYYLHL